MLDIVAPQYQLKHQEVWMVNLALLQYLVGEGLFDVDGSCSEEMMGRVQGDYDLRRILLVVQDIERIAVDTVSNQDIVEDTAPIGDYPRDVEVGAVVVHVADQC